MIQIKLHRNEIEKIKSCVEVCKQINTNKDLYNRIIAKMDKALSIPIVVRRSEQLKCIMKHDDGNCNCDIKHCEDGGW